MSSNSVDKAKSASNDALAKIFNSPLDKRITQMTRILSTAQGIDSTFCFLGYGLVFVSSQLQLLSQTSPPLVEKISSKPALLRAEFKAKMLGLALSAKTLGGVFSDARTFLRLWGLLKIYVGMKAAYLNPPKDGILKALSWAQLSTMAGYFVYENQVYLASKGVLRGPAYLPAELGKKLRLAIWLFTGYLVMDFARLFRLSQLSRKNQSVVRGEKEIVDESGEIAKREEESRAWYRSLWVDSSYFPLCFHWGIEGGSLPVEWADMVVGFLGACAGYAGFREQVRLTS